MSGVTGTQFLLEVQIVPGPHKWNYAKDSDFYNSICYGYYIVY